MNEPRFALWGTGFRPFFLLGALWATILLPLWVLRIYGVIGAPILFDPMTWHAHELLFGFTSAIIAGFLLTAAQNWTGETTAKGTALKWLVLLWIIPRVALIYSGPAPTAVVYLTSALDLAFLPALAFFVGRPIFKVGHPRNRPIVYLLLIMSAGNFAVHGQALGLFDLPTRGKMVAVDVITLLMLIIGSRVVPMFTRNKLNVEFVRRKGGDYLSNYLVGTLLLFDIINEQGQLVGGIALVAGLATLYRMSGWRFGRTLKTPMLWSLHLGYAWIGVSLILRGLGGLEFGIPQSAAIHGMTAGAIGTLTIAMMTRVSLGHTGRKIVSKPLNTVSFVLMTVTAIVRTFGPIVAPGHPAIIDGAATGWVLAFAIYLVTMTGTLLTPRPDGKAG